MISCLMVTRPGRLRCVERSLQCFAAQAFDERELVILHDGDEVFHRALQEIAGHYPRADIHIHQAPAGKTLGELRNISLSLAAGPFICQWDDDDLFHPRRLSEQFDQMREAGADCCFFTDQLHWFERIEQWYWDDWSLEEPPGHLIQGSILARREIMPPYPHEPRGEDTGQLYRLLETGARVTTLEGRGYLYIYTYNGENTWDFPHHAAISRVKRKRREFLEAHRTVLTRHLRDYRLPLREAVFPVDHGAVVLDLT